MADIEHPQLYLVTPAEIDLDSFPDLLARVLDSTPIACVRLALASRDEDRIIRACDALRAVTEARDVAFVIENHVLLAERLGLDGVHLADGARSVRKARKQLGGEAIVGAFCGASRHDGMNAGEAGADYVSFGPVGGPLLGDGTLAERALFAWWSEMIEVPVVAEGGLTPQLAEAIAGVTDFIALGDEIWSKPEPVQALEAFVSAVR